MDNLQKLRQANPHIAIHTIHEEAFKPYGRVIDMDTAPFCAGAEKLPMPEEGSKYVPSTPELDELPEAKAFRESCCGGLDEQIGLCWGHSGQLNALEWHTCNEFNIAAQELVLLLAKRADLDEDGRLDSAKVQAFYVGTGEAIEVYSDTLHFCPCEVTEEGFRCVVALQRGTNLPIDEAQKVNKLWAANKWLLGHEANAGLIQRGAYPGIYGENWQINPVK